MCDLLTVAVLLLGPIKAEALLGLVCWERAGQRVLWQERGTQGIGIST